MATLTLHATPQPAILHQRAESQICYVLLTIAASRPAKPHPIHWAIVADASRSMRIPIVDEAQFRALVQHGSVQETLVDGVPAWQLSAPLPPELRAAVRSPLDHVADALQSVVEQLHPRDRFALVAATQTARVLISSTSGAARARLIEGIAQLRQPADGEQTDLACGMVLALDELRRGRDAAHAERLLILSDGFVEDADACLHIAEQAAAEGVAVCMLGLGGDVQEDLLLALAERSGTEAVLLCQPNEIAGAMEQELARARSVVARNTLLHLTLADGVQLRRVTRICPTRALLPEPTVAPITLHAGELNALEPMQLLFEFLVSPGRATTRPLAQITVAADAARATYELFAAYQPQPAALPQAVLDAAARATAARLQSRARAADSPREAAQLLRAAAARLDDLGEHRQADAARRAADHLEHVERTDAAPLQQSTNTTHRMDKKQEDYGSFHAD